MRFITKLLLKEVKDPKRIGKIGEEVLAKLVKMNFLSENIFRNVYVKCSNDKLTEIDIIAVDKRGIFVFEMKNYGGYIYGTRDSEYFIQSFSSRQKYKILNPVKQNEYHIKCLSEYLNNNNNNKIPIFNIVVVSNHCYLRIVNINNIIRIKEVEKYLNIFTKEELSIEEVKDIVEKIKTLKNS